MPDTINLFDSRRMVAALEQRHPPRTFFLDMFFTTTDISDSEYVDIDIDRGGKRIMAAFVNPKAKGTVVERRGYKTRSYKVPYVKPKRVCTAEDLLKRSIGENVYAGAKSPMQRAAEMVGKDLADMEDMIIRREEWMAAQGLQTGTINVQGEGVDDLVSFDMLPTHLVTLSGTALWSAASTAVPLDNIREWCVDIVQKDSGLVPKDVILGRNAINYFLKTEQVLGNSTGGKSVFDMRNLNMGIINPRTLPNGVKYYGYLPDPGIDLWTYDEWFYNDVSDTTDPIMNPNKVLIGCTDARCVRHYGAIKDPKSPGQIKRFPKSWEEEDPPVRYVMVQSAPLPVPHQVDGFLCATVC